MDSTSTAAPSPPSQPAEGTEGRWERLLRRWFVDYNPVYLLSAMLVLGGVTLSSRGLAQEGSVHGSLGVALVAEIYACVLIASAALLTRIEQRRPAVLLALITVLYQADLTLHTETCVYLGSVGTAAALTWVALFAGKLHALAWALRIRLTWRAMATATMGAAGLALGPQIVPLLGGRATGIALSLFVFALATLHPRTAEETASSLVPLDEWALRVFRRSIRATWILWAVAASVHVLFWASQRTLSLGFVALSVLFLVAGRLQRESRVWVSIVGLLAVVLVVSPASFAISALFASLALGHRAFGRVQTVSVAPSDSHDTSPYRTPAEGSPASTTTIRFQAVDAAARARLLSGALLALYLSGWTAGHHGAGLPDHAWWLDVTLGAAAVALGWRLRTRAPLVPLGIVYAHGLLASGLVPHPRSLVGWGGTAVATGFVLLLGSVAMSYRLRRAPSAPQDG